MKLTPAEKRRIEDGIAAMQATDREENLERTVRAEAWAIVRADGTFLPYDEDAHSIAVYRRRKDALLISVRPPERVIPVTITEELPKKGKRKA